MFTNNNVLVYIGEGGYWVTQIEILRSELVYCDAILLVNYI